MARFPDHFIQQVAAATDIVDLISQYVALKKRGREFLGLCPFHEDNRPSLNVSATKQIFKCFACGAGGGVFQFIEKYEKLPFPEAVKMLAQRANIPLPRALQEAPTPAGLSKADLIGLMTFAAKFYRQRLGSPAGTAALSYVRQRGLSDESLERFGIGYAPDSWDALSQAASKQGHSEAQLLAAGLVARSEQRSGCYDRFRNRLIFPILNPAGEIVAFGGRALDPADRAKYLNSPDSILFDKSALLYALNWSREAIVAGGRAVVVEGYFDALMPLQAGVGNVVATMGTSLSDRHVRLLSRYAREVVLVFDSDLAGARAAERALELFLLQQIHVRVATIPEGKDPCDFCLAKGGEAFRSLVEAAPDALQYIWGRRLESCRQAGDDLAARRRAMEDFLRLVASSSAYGVIDSMRRGQLAQHIGHMLNISPGDLEAHMRRLIRQVPPRPTPGMANQGVPQGDPQRQVIEVLLNRPDLFDSVSASISPEDFADADMRQLAEHVWQLARSGRLRIDELLARQDLSVHAALLAELSEGGERRGNYEDTLAGAIEHLLGRRRKLELQDMKSSGLNDDALRRLDESLRQADPRRHPRIT